MQIALRRSDAVHLLTEWGKWARRCPSKTISYPSIEPFTRLVTPSGTPPDISDPAAILIDQGIASIRQRNSLMGRIVALYYYTGLSYARLAEEMNELDSRQRITRHQVCAYVQSGNSWIDGYLNSG